jgi:hypothetical protein
MAHKLAFQLTDASAPNHFSIRLVDKKQASVLAVAEGFAKPIALEPIVVVYDEGSGELVPVNGFDDTTARGRIAMKIVADIYSDALDQITTRGASGEGMATKVTARGSQHARH